MAASESALGKLHQKLAEVMSEALDGEELPGYIDPDTGEEVAGLKQLPSASVMTVVAKFLKDNEITCAPSEDNSITELANKLADKQRKLRGIDSTDRAAIMSDIGAMGSA